MVTLLIATRNAHKVGEIRAILGEGFRFLTLSDVPNSPEVIEDAGTFAGNATKKAVALARWLGEAQRLESNVAALKPGVQKGLFELRNGPRAVPARSAQENAGALGKSDRPGAQRAAASRDGSRSGGWMPRCSPSPARTFGVNENPPCRASHIHVGQTRRGAGNVLRVAFATVGTRHWLQQHHRLGLDSS